MVEGISTGSTSGNCYVQNKKAESTARKENAQVIQGDTIEIGTSSEKDVTYGKNVSRKEDADEISRLMKEAEKSKEVLRLLVQKLISGQSGKEALAEARKEAQQAISEDGEWGVEAVSDRIVNFAIAVSGGDKSKLNELKEAIDKGFQAAAQAFGGTLPEISMRTYDAIMEKLDKWSKEDTQTAADSE